MSRWSLDAPSGTRLGTGRGWADYDLRDELTSEQLASFTETSWLGPVTSANAHWLARWQVGLSSPVDDDELTCVVQPELRSPPQPPLTWLRCAPGGSFAVLEHTDGRLLLVAGADERQEMVRAMRPRRVGSDTEAEASDGFSVFRARPGRRLVAAARGANEGFMWVTEVATLGRREISLVTNTTGFASASEAGGDKIRFQGRLARGRVDYERHEVELFVVPGCGRGVTVRGEASAGAAFVRLLELLATAEPDPRQEPECARWRQPLSPKADRPPERSPKVGIGVLVAAVVTLGGVAVWVRRRAR